MLKNYFKIAIRILSKNKFFTVLNVIGLALGMSLSLLFIALLAFLFRYDDFHPNRDRIYRVTTQLQDNQENPLYASAPAGLAQKLSKDITGVEKVVRINRSLAGQAIYNEKKLQLWGYFADPEFLEVFNFPLLKGNKANALSKPNTMLITASEASKIFGSKEAVGEIIRMDPYGDFVITGVLENLPENSHMQFGAIASYATLLSNKQAARPEGEEGWKSFTGSYVYLLLYKDSAPAKIKQFLDKVAKKRYAKQTVKASFRLQPIDDIVPGPQLYDSLGNTWAFLSLLVSGLLTLMVLIPACSNYVNLTISQSLERMKEIGVRKVMGGGKKHIFFQFIIESTLIMLLALLLGFLIYEAVRKDFLLQMVEVGPVDLSPNWITIVGFFLFALLVGLVAGIVPALYFSKISTISALKGKEVKTSGRSYFRKIVLTIQFMLSLGFIMAVVTMMRQYQYSVNYDLGFAQENILDVELQNVDPQLFKNEYQKLSSVHKISLSSHLLGVGAAPVMAIQLAHQADSVEAASISVDEAFIANMQLEMLAGRSFSDNTLENSRLVVVNEDFALKLTPEDPFAAISKPLVLPDGREVQIAGVVKNFHYSGLKDAIQPFYFEYDPAQFYYANLKLEPGDLMEQLTTMESLWKNIGGEGKFTAQLFSHKIRDMYSDYIMIMKLWGFLGLLAITVTCLGLLGTVSFTTKKRFKEISIRKVLGASSESLVLLLSKDFIILMVIASIITIPAIYLLFIHLLATLQHYTIQIGFIEIFVSLMIMIFLGLATILSQTLKAANANPADNLRSE